MQTFSDLQRNSVNPRALTRDALILAALIVYEALGNIYYLLPPLFGFWFAIVAAKKEPRLFWIAIGYILFFEADHSLIIGSGCLFLYLFSRFIVPAMEDFIMSRRLVILLSVTIGYICYYGFISLIYIAFGLDPIPFSYLVLYYIAIEAIVATAALR